MTRIPKKFVGLHAHTGSSSYDGLGPPEDHFKFCLENGLDAHAITEHGHCTSFAKAYLWSEKHPELKYLAGCEMYVHPDLDQWKLDAEHHKKTQEDHKLAKKEAKKLAEEQKTRLIIKKDEDDETLDIEMSNALTIENEEETKGSTKHFKPINRRHHMVVLPKTSRALMKMFHLVSKGFLEGFYRFPRIDFKMLKQAAQECDNELIISGACLGGVFSYETLRACQDFEFDKLDASVLDDPAIMKRVMDAIGNTHDKLVDAVGEENVYLELQFNKIKAQDLVNRALVEYARRNSLKQQLIVTADSHYPRPELWKTREMYKRLGWMNYTDFNPDSIPKSVDELKCELYPKNAEQIWNEYQRAKTENTWYDDDEVCDAIERTHDIAHHVIGDVKFDKSPKYPVKVTMKGGDPFTILLEKSLAGLKKKNLHKKKEYVDRLRHELEVIQKLDNSPYFVLMERVIQLAKTVTLVGVGRGSSGGSLVAYCLGITDIDPIKYECRFDRFQNVHRCLDPDTIVRTEHGDVKIKDLNIGDLIFDSNHILQNVTAKFNTTTSSIIKFTLGDQIIICSENHLWPIVRNGEKLIVKANEVTIFDELIYERDTETV